MKKFLLKILLFASILTAFAYIIDICISKGLISMSDYRFQTWNEISKNEINADLLINGNSRGLSHYVPSVFDSVLNTNSYNIGFGGHPFNAEYLKYHYYISHNKIPKVLIQNVDFLTLSDIFVIGHEREQILPFVKDTYLRKHLPDYGFNLFEIYIPLVRYFGYQKEIKNGLFEKFGLKHYFNTTSEKGFLPEKGVWDPTELNKIEKIPFDKDSFSVDLFIKYLSELKNDNVKVFLVNSPVYYKATEKLEEKAEMYEFYSEIARRFGFIYLDYTSDSLCFDSTMFVKAVHMNKTGAVKFSKKLASDLRKYKLDDLITRK